MEPTKKRLDNLKPALVTAIVILIIMTLFAGWAAQQLPADISVASHL
ncbi:MAG: hypothetical protein L6422_06075 [Candidatus Marinimicrobia bacterium]|nr:hypothetical protein [Candidatus Neomarinimicrobiota bacterium]